MMMFRCLLFEMRACQQFSRATQILTGMKTKQLLATSFSSYINKNHKTNPGGLSINMQDIGLKETLLEDSQDAETGFCLPDPESAYMVFRNTIKMDKYLTQQEWETLTNDLLGRPYKVVGHYKRNPKKKNKKEPSTVFLNSVTLPSAILLFCGKLKFVHCARSWIDLKFPLEAIDNVQMNQLVSLFLQIDLKQHDEYAIKFARKCMNEDMSEKSTFFWKGLQILGRTKHWMEAYQIYMNLPPTRVCVEAAVSIGISALKEDQPDIAFNLIDDPKFHNYASPLLRSDYYNYEKQEILFKEIIAYSLTLGRITGRTVEERLYTTLQKNNLHITPDFCEFLQKHEQDLNRLRDKDEKGNREARVAKIEQSGICRNCGNSLPRTPLTQDEFELLKTTLVDTLIRGDDVYKYSSPEELQNFLKFLEREGPFDVVMDGLNISLQCSASNKRASKGFKSASMSSNDLLSVVDYFFRLDKRVLVIHRAQIRSYPTYRTIRQKARVVVMDDHSYDDFYTILASLHYQCLMMSNDTMHDHVSRLKEQDKRLAQLFVKWQVAHQIYMQGFQNLDRISRPVGMRARPQLVFPPAHDVSPGKAGQHWHLPISRIYEGEVSDGRRYLYHGQHHEWLCIGPKVNRRSVPRKKENVEFVWPQSFASKETPWQSTDPDHIHGSIKSSDHFTGSLRENTDRYYLNQPPQSRHRKQDDNTPHTLQHQLVKARGGKTKISKEVKKLKELMKQKDI